MSKSSKLTADQISLSLREMELRKFQFDDSKAIDEGLLLMFGYHVILAPNDKVANVGVKVAISNSEVESASYACEMVTHFTFSLQHQETGRALSELGDDRYKVLTNEIVLYLVNIIHSTVRGMWYMATRGTNYHHGFDIHLPVPGLDRIRVDMQ